MTLKRRFLAGNLPKLYTSSLKNTESTKVKLTLHVDVPQLVCAASDAVYGAADVCAGVVATDRTDLELAVDGEHLRIVGSTPAHRWLRVTVHLTV